ncbi:MAG: NAD-dependent epimerase/dehydratase family protein [Victivallaceae bacterium]|nr:NAD-dependent epimerase/dehydratase family protein [Victivallaceae bacterium]
MKVLIIGGSGHVSGAVTGECLKQGFEVTILTRGQRPVPGGVKVLKADRRDAEAMRSLFNAATDFYDAVFDCICYEPEAMEIMLELFRQRTRQLLFVSTDFVFDPVRRSFPQPVDAPCLTNNAGGLQDYGFKKRACENLLAAEATGEFSWTVFRPCHIYGMFSQLGCFPDHRRDPELIGRLQRGEVLTLVDGGHFLQQPIEAGDLAKTMVSAVGRAKARREIFNMAGPDIVESWAYYQIIADTLGVKLKIRSTPLTEYIQLHPEHKPFLCHRIYNHEKLHAAGLAVPATPLTEGLRRHTLELMQYK